jgi:hypothetical protein
MPSPQEGVGQDARPGGHHQWVLGLFGGQDVPISSHPGGVGLAQLQQQDRSELVALGEQAGGAKLGVAVQFPSRELAGSKQLR